MIARELLTHWLTLGIRFANLPAGFSDDDARNALHCWDDPNGAGPEEWDGGEFLQERTVMGPDGKPHMVAKGVLYVTDEAQDFPADPPEDGYAALHLSWRNFLRQLTRGEASRRWCERHFETRDRWKNFGVPQKRTTPTVKFDEDGRPQLAFVDLIRPEGMLALVGAELLSPDAAVEVRQCARQDCNRFLTRKKIGRGRGAPQKYCTLPDGKTSHCPDATERKRLTRDNRKPRTLRKLRTANSSLR